MHRIGAPSFFVMKTPLTHSNKLEEIRQELSFSKETVLPLSLFSGKAGVLLFRFYLQEATDKPDHELEDDLIDFIQQYLNGTVSGFSFANGVAGISWFLDHIVKKEYVELDEELLGFYDDTLIEAAHNYLKVENHDFMHGALGIMFYLLNRGKESPQLIPELTRLTETLGNLAMKQPQGIAWREQNDFLEGEENAIVINLHISHGQASKIVFLSEAVEAGIQVAEPLLKSAVEFLLDATDPTSGKIPSRLIDSIADFDKHSGWCRSNIAIGLALLKAGNSLKDEPLKERAIAIGRAAIKEIENNPERLTEEPTFCHGACGISTMFRQYYKETGLKEFETAANFWLNRTLNLDRFKDGVAGYKTWESTTGQWLNNLGLLSGVAGIGCAILSASTMDSPLSWEECFLIG